MLPNAPELLELFSMDHRHRQAVARAERLRGAGSLRVRAASLLRGLADQLSPLPAPPRAASVPAAHSVRSVRSRCYPAA